MPKIDIIEVALKKAVGINATPEENVAFSRLDNESQAGLYELICSYDYMDDIKSMLMHFIKVSPPDEREEIIMKCINWIDTIKTKEDEKVNIKNLIKSC